MKGLVIKDIQLLLQQRLFIGAVIVLSAGIALASEEGPEFICGYITILFALQAIGTVSYDELDNGFLYLFTLPTTRKLYVVEKYLFCTAVSLCACMLSVVLILVTQADTVVIRELVMIAVATFLASLLMIGISLPMNMKYGAEKGRIAIFAFAAVVIVAAMFLEKGQEYLAIDVNALLAHMSSTAFEVGAGVVVTMLFVISFFISMRVMEKKQF